MKLFCKHVYIRESKQFIGMGTVETGSIITADYRQIPAKAYLVVYRCVKCDKIKKDVIFQRD